MSVCNRINPNIQHSRLVQRRNEWFLMGSDCTVFSKCSSRPTEIIPNALILNKNHTAFKFSRSVQDVKRVFSVLYLWHVEHRNCYHFSPCIRSLSVKSTSVWSTVIVSQKKITKQQMIHIQRNAVAYIKTMTSFQWATTEFVLFVDQ
jgi:hypothetical protein